MPLLNTLRISTAPAYDVCIGRGMLPGCGEWLRGLHDPCAVALVSDDAVAALYADTVEKSLAAAGFTVCRFVFPHGEGFKTAETLFSLLGFLAAHAFTRTDLIAALGGGVTGDMAGFAAAVYLRGVEFVQIPTTLLAMVDSSVGGKTAVDLPQGKNLVGAFKQPRGVLCDCDTLATLPPAELANGLAEAIKTGVLAGEDLFSLLEDGVAKDTLPAIISRCVRYKGDIVAADERDHGCRQLLNLGHTIGHAIEQVSGFSLPHGQAVAIGMAAIARAAAAKGFADPLLPHRIEKALIKAGLPVTCDYTAENLAAVAGQDKKRRGDTLTLVVPQAVGDCRFVPIDIAAFIDWIRAGERA